MGEAAIHAVLLCCLSLAAPAGELKPQQPADGRLDACSLITRSEIEAVQREPVIETKSSQPERGAFAVSQCFYTVATFARSVSLEATLRDPRKPAAEGPRDHWRRVFHRTAEGDREQEEKRSAKSVSGIGEEAYWVATGPVAALYALENNAFIRISIGGAEAEPVKLKKSKSLARKALKRLP